VLVASCTPSNNQEAHVEDAGSGLEAAEDLADRLGQFAPTELTVDLDSLTEEERDVLGYLVEASRYMDEIFLHQVWSGAPEMRSELQQSTQSAANDARALFEINFGPWDRLKELEPFLGSRTHPEGAGYYPEDMTKAEFEQWLVDHPDDKAAFSSLTTVIRRRDPDLVAVPYSTEYREWLEPAAERLRMAAARTSNESLKNFLELRAEAFFSDDYYESDMAWMDLDSPVEVTIGPYETYEDGLFGYKAAFTAFITVGLPDESAKLDKYKQQLPWLERNLPIPDQHKNLDRGTESPMRVVDELFTGGDTKAGVQTIAFNLPNDERVREAKGSKKVMLRNIMRAKFDQILVPIGGVVLSPDDREKISFEAYFNEVLHHELSHGLGPGNITVDGRATEVRLELRDLYSTLEEAKADVMGVYNILALIESGQMPADLRSSLEPTYVAGLFRSARFGVHEAHGQGTISQFNYLMEKGALEVDAQGQFRTVSENFPGAIRDLLEEMLMLQANGDYPGTAEFLERYGKPSASLLEAIDSLSQVPVDVKPLYPQADELTRDRS
jgi:hypothetical protein